MKRKINFKFESFHKWNALFFSIFMQSDFYSSPSFWSPFLAFIHKYITKSDAPWFYRGRLCKKCHLGTDGNIKISIVAKNSKNVGKTGSRPSSDKRTIFLQSKSVKKVVAFYREPSEYSAIWKINSRFFRNTNLRRLLWILNTINNIKLITKWFDWRLSIKP